MLCLSISMVTGAQAQGTGRQYFRETGHSVSGDFLDYYRSVKNATLLFGFPITEQFPKDGLIVQYFQRARFELHPEQPPGQRVQLTSIGREMYTPGLPVGNDNDPSCRLFAETGIAVCFSFLQFYEQNGGAAIFGYPISRFEYRDDLIVQYFEKARFEWRPNMPEGQHVGLTDMGRFYFDFKKEDVNLLKSLRFDEIGVQVPLSIKARAFAWKAVTLSTDQQLVYVVVQDQTLQPIAGASGTAVIRWPDGSQETLAIVTNSNGFGVVPLSFANLRYGNRITVEVTINKDGLTSITKTSFRIWY